MLRCLVRERIFTLGEFVGASDTRCAAISSSSAVHSTMTGSWPTGQLIFHSPAQFPDRMTTSLTDRLAKCGFHGRRGLAAFVALGLLLSPMPEPFRER
jgi:hypothetical protein